FTTITFTDLTNTYALQNGDMIHIQFTGGDANNYVQMDTNNTNPFDGVNSDLMVSPDMSTFIETAGSDAAMTFWSLGTGAVTPPSAFYVVAGNNNPQILYNGAETR